MVPRNKNNPSTRDTKPTQKSPNTQPPNTQDARHLAVVDTFTFTRAHNAYLLLWFVPGTSLYDTESGRTLGVLGVV